MEAVAVSIGTAFLNSSIDYLVQKIGSPEVLGFFNDRELDEELLEKLAETLNTINGLLTDAEEQQITVTAVKNWLDGVKDAAYEAEDLLDEINYETRRSEVEADSQVCTDQVRKAFSSFNPFSKKKEQSKIKKQIEKTKEEMVGNLEKIFAKLERLKNQAHTFHLIERFGDRLPSQTVPTTSRLGGSRVFGRDDAKNAITSLLLSDEAKSKTLEVVPIVGMGGIGKTTLAKFVYNDKEVQEWFDLKVWVHVSQAFDVIKLTKDILKGVGLVACDSMIPDQLHCELEKILTGKRLLLVLDDVWSVNQSKWDFVLAPLQSGAHGSKILVTTRDHSITSAVQSAPPFPLKPMSPDDCWLLFSEHAFRGENYNARLQLEEKFRLDTVRRCDGLPLAAKSLGSLLKSKKDVAEWKNVLNSKIWDMQNDNILPVLRLSYYYLPSHLKQCFAYCSIFPKGFIFKKEDVVLWWMAEGFLPDKQMEEAGYAYFEDLVSRSFFEQVSDSPSFTMHDLTNDLARFVSGEFSIALGDGDSYTLSCKTRHLSCPRKRCEGLKNLMGIELVQNLRTLLPVSNDFTYSNTLAVEIQNSLPRFKRLRVLSLSNHANVVQLLDSIGMLKHLRHLDLSETSMERLPKFVCVSYNLQTLILAWCRDLVELPADMFRLTNLYHLDIKGTSLQGMPPRISKLTNLHMLTDFFVGKQIGSSIMELGELKCLQGELRVWNLENVADTEDAVKADLKGKEKLKVLSLRWTSYVNFEDLLIGDDQDQQRRSGHEIDVFEQLQPHTNIEGLEIIGYGGTKLPSWVGDPSFSNIVSLKLITCKRCSSLPPLGQLAYLKVLWVEAFDQVVWVGPEFYGGAIFPNNPFQSLEQLTFSRMPKWCTWIPYVDRNEGRAFPRLQVLCIEHCPLLTTALTSHLPPLIKIEIRDCPCLVFSLQTRSPAIKKVLLNDQLRDLKLVESATSGMQHLTVSEFDNLDSLLKEMELLGYCSALQEIYIRRCSVKYFPLKLFPNLKVICFWECSVLESLTAQGGPCGDFTSTSSLKICDHPNLETLLLSDCSDLKLLNCFFPSLVDLTIYNCPELESFSIGSVSSKLTSLFISHCDKLVAGRKQWDLQRLSSLSHFSFGGCKELESFPEEEMLLPPALISLQIWDLPDLKSVGHDALQHLSSLTNLKVEECSKLQFMHLPSTLTSLEIRDLTNLKSLDDIGLKHLTLLREFYIRGCPVLESMPEDGLPSSLTYLTIWGCPLLEQWYQRQMREDRSKISRTLKIEISGNKIN